MEPSSAEDWLDRLESHAMIPSSFGEALTRRAVGLGVSGDGVRLRTHLLPEALGEVPRVASGEMA
jgi:hypothetical protein